MKHLLLFVFVTIMLPCSLFAGESATVYPGDTFVWEKPYGMTDQDLGCDQKKEFTLILPDGVSYVSGDKQFTFNPSTWVGTTSGTTYTKMKASSSIAPGTYYIKWKEVYYRKCPFGSWSLISTQYSSFKLVVKEAPIATRPSFSTYSISNNCPTETVNLGSFSLTNSIPSGANLTWHTGSTATNANKITNLTVSSSGTYYASFYKSSVGYGTTRAVTVNISACNQTPVMGADVSISVSENTSGVFYTSQATDADGDTLTYSIDDNAATDGSAVFSINPNTGEVKFITAPDYENPTDIYGTANDNIYRLRVKVCDSYGNCSSVQKITVTVTNVDESVIGGGEPDFFITNQLVSGFVNTLQDKQYLLIRLAEINGVQPNQGSLSLYITKNDTVFDVLYNGSVTTSPWFTNVTLSNPNWSLNTTNPIFYILTYSGTLSANMSSNILLEVSPKLVVNGEYSIITYLNAGTTGDTNSVNNSTTSTIIIN